MNPTEADRVPPSRRCCLFNFEHFRPKKRSIRDRSHRPDSAHPLRAVCSFSMGKPGTGRLACGAHGQLQARLANEGCDLN